VSYNVIGDIDGSLEDVSQVVLEVKFNNE